ncbi:hypothetical protein RSAG8_08788, partial [Rhizoctonia solani AG-8 WAC10335]
MLRLMLHQEFWVWRRAGCGVTLRIRPLLHSTTLLTIESTPSCTRLICSSFSLDGTLGNLDICLDWDSHSKRPTRTTTIHPHHRPNISAIPSLPVHLSLIKAHTFLKNRSTPCFALRPFSSP